MTKQSLRFVLLEIYKTNYYLNNSYIVNVLWFIVIFPQIVVNRNWNYYSSYHIQYIYSIYITVTITYISRNLGIYTLMTRNTSRLVYSYTEEDSLLFTNCYELIPYFNFSLYTMNHYYNGKNINYILILLVKQNELRNECWCIRNRGINILSKLLRRQEDICKLCK